MKTQKNITRSNLFLICICMSFTGLICCSKTDDVMKENISCANWSEQFVSLSNSFNLAFQIYADDPTLANCNNYKSAGIDYIDAMEGLLDCIPSAFSEEFTNDLNDSRAEINGISCN